MVIKTVKDLRDALTVLIDEGKGSYRLYIEGALYDIVKLDVDDDEDHKDQKDWLPTIDIDGEYSNYN